MRATRRRDTRPEIEVRRLLHAAGLRYRVDWPLPTNPRRRADIAFPKHKIIVFIDGCFWHRCPQHYVPPKANSAHWDTKTQANAARDGDTDRRLRDEGWLVLRFWEHEDPASAACTVSRAVTDRTTQLGRAQRGHEGPDV